VGNFVIRPDILEVTLRDGSYLIDFQFTDQDTQLIAGALQAVGFRWIEVGHGLGLNASRTGKGSAAATDEQYLESAAEALTTARWGMFFIPGIGRQQDLRLAANYGMHFVRVGTNINELGEAEPFIKQAKDLGLLVSYNGMKSYAVSPEHWGECARKAEQWGADIVCLVDSAGSMYPDEVSSYIRAAQSRSCVPLGFHGHDNLSLAMANCLSAIDAGAVLVDSSLQGMGRSAGNAITEVLVAILTKRGLLPGIDMKAVMDIGTRLIRPLLGRRGIDSMAVTGGFAGFHSAFTPTLLKYAQKHDIDVRDLMVRLCQEDQISAPDELLERLGEELARARMPRVLQAPAFAIRTQKHGADGRETLESLLRELYPRAAKAGSLSALNAVIGEGPQHDMRVSGNIQQTPTHVVGSVTYTTDEQLKTILDAAEGRVDLLLLDVDRKSFGPAYPATTAAGKLRTTNLLTYLDSRVWAAAAEDQATRLLGENLEGVRVVIAGDHAKSYLLAIGLAERRAHVTLVGKQAFMDPVALCAFSFSPQACSITCLEAGTVQANEHIAHARLVVIWPGGVSWFGRAEATILGEDALVLVADSGALLAGALEAIQERRLLLVRVNMWPTLAGALFAAHESQRVCRESMGRSIIAEIPVVAGGAWGREGDVIIDNVKEPSRVIGIADGRGGLIFQYSTDQFERVRRVTGEIHSRMLAPHLVAVQ
jgi:4-hydroxy-2-oxovalerate aldolase